jgi:hypothetical protein
VFGLVNVICILTLFGFVHRKWILLAGFDT